MKNINSNLLGNNFETTLRMNLRDNLNVAVELIIFENIEDDLNNNLNIFGVIRFNLARKLNFRKY